MRYVLPVTKSAISNTKVVLTPQDAAHYKSTPDLSKLYALKHKLNPQKYVLVVGIGGSSLGSKAIYNSIFGYYDNIETNRFPKIIFIETESDVFNEKLITLLNSIDPNDLVINIISKSGTTAETTFNFELILKNFPNFKNRIVITTQEQSPLSNLAHELNIDLLEIPKELSGRFSVFSYVGLFPLILANIDISKLLEGSDLALQDLQTPLDAALSKHQAYETNCFINNLFIFSPALETLGDWHSQLVAESTGKDNKGILPTTSIGSNDLHSIAQFYLGGNSANIFFTFMSIKTEIHLNKLLNATKEAFTNKGIAYDEIILETVNEIELGYFMQFKMLETIFLAKLIGVNPFNQPNVEDYKKYISRT